MAFKTLKRAVQQQFQQMLKDGQLFVVASDKDKIWDAYISSFEPIHDPVFDKRTEHDCSCCRNFIRQAGPIVQITSSGEIVSIWDIEVEEQYKKPVEALRKYVKSLEIAAPFFSSENKIGQDKSRGLFENNVRSFEHFYLDIPSKYQKLSRIIPTVVGEYRTKAQTLTKALEEISEEALDIVIELIRSNSLYRGQEKARLVEGFRKLKMQYLRLPVEKRKSFVWLNSANSNSWIAGIRNDVIGTLLVDISSGVELEIAAKSFEDKVSGTNYKRPTALITENMRKKAKETLEDLGLLSALDRRYANVNDISVNNVIYVQYNAKKDEDVFDSLSVKTKKPILKGEKEITIENFLQNILPTAKEIKVFFDNEHASNLVSLVTAANPGSSNLFKWDSSFSWSYVGEVADSIKQRVKSAGGKVEGDLCCRLSWDNIDDLDLHMVEKYSSLGTDHICYIKKHSLSGGELDVDFIPYSLSQNPCENIVYENSSRMRAGTYTLYIHCYTKRNSKGEAGFGVEIELLGQKYIYSHDSWLKEDEKVIIGDFIVDSTGNITFKPAVDTNSTSTKEVWGIKTNTLVPVKAIMFSPNYWDDQQIGNKHIFFMLENCINSEGARPFYNEFLKSELDPHRKVMEMVGAKLTTEHSEEQLSGLGFSFTKKAELIVEVTGAYKTLYKVKF